MPRLEMHFFQKSIFLESVFGIASVCIFGKAGLVG